MTAEEMEVLTAASNLAYDGGLGVWQHLADDVGRLDWDLRYPSPTSMKKVAFQIGEDSGPVIVPKLCRRPAVWEVMRWAKRVTGGLIQ